MGTGPTERRWDAADLLYEIGRRTQAAAMMMRKHRVSPTHELCQCGRLPHRRLPLFGPRCEVASAHWEQAAYAMRQLLRHADRHGARPAGERTPRSVGRARVVTPAARPPGVIVGLDWLRRRRQRRTGQ